MLLYNNPWMAWPTLIKPSGRFSLDVVVESEEEPVVAVSRESKVVVEPDDVEVEDSVEPDFEVVEVGWEIEVVIEVESEVEIAVEDESVDISIGVGEKNPPLPSALLGSFMSGGGLNPLPLVTRVSPMEGNIGRGRVSPI